MEFMGEKLYTMEEILRMFVKFSKKMFEYLRNTLKLIPSPIKVSSGKGIIAYYPECAVNHLKKIMDEHKKGKSFALIKCKFEDETERVFQRCEYLRRQYQLERRSKAELAKSLMADDQPSPFLKIRDVNTANLDRVKVDEDVLLQVVSDDLREEFKKWDGKSLEGLYRIRSKIDKFEQLQVRKRVKKDLKELIK